MPNAIKYSTSPQTLALKDGNFWIGTGDVGKGPTSTTDYWNGITPPAGGYTIYLNKASGGPSIYTAANDSQLISLSNTIAGQTFATAAAALDWFATQTDRMVFNIDYPAIVTDGLSMTLDAGFTPSYPTTGTTWYNMSGTSNGSLLNGPTYNSSDGGSLIFDGVDDVCRFPANFFNSGAPQNGTFYVRIKFPTLSTTTQTILFSDGGSTNNLIYLYRNSNFPTNEYRWLIYYNGGFYLQGTTYTPGAWADTAFTFDSSGTAAFYKNGSLVNSQTMSGFTSWSRSGNNAGGFSPASAAGAGNGQLFYYYTRALSASEILQIFNATKSRIGL